ncbi:MAG: NAD(P)H-hydrate epimerase [Chloroflexota bacterium]
MREVDRAMIDDYGIELVQMMENAGRAVAHLARVRFLHGDPGSKRVLVLAGSGGNGGGALVSARHLHNAGAAVQVITTREPDAFTDVPRRQLDILHRMGLPIYESAETNDVGAAELIIDGLIGYSLRGAPRGVAADLIHWANDQAAPILALDTPSGLDTTTGTIHVPTIQATATLTLALPKEGLRAPGAESHSGELYLADISVPPGLYARPPLNLNVAPLFAKSDIVRLR